MVQLLLLVIGGWVNRRQLDVIEYLQEENRILKARLGGRRFRFTDAERRLLARKVRALRQLIADLLARTATEKTLIPIPWRQRI
jgi:hypothetical protein